MWGGACELRFGRVRIKTVVILYSASLDSNGVGPLLARLALGVLMAPLSQLEVLDCLFGRSDWAGLNSHTSQTELTVRLTWPDGTGSLLGV